MDGVFFNQWWILTFLNINVNQTDLFLHSDIRNWIRNIEQHASDNVNKILVGNKADMDESKRVCPPLSVCVCVCVCMCLHMHAHAGVRMHTCISFPWLLLMLTWWWPYFQAVPTSKGQALADEYGIKFFETVSKLCCLYWLVGFFFLSSFFLCCEACELQSAKTNLNVEEVFFSIARDIKQRLADTDSRAEV